MLAPKRILHRKVQRGSMKGQAKGNTELHFGEFGIQALEAHWITNRQIEEVAREALRLAQHKLPIKTKIVVAKNAEQRIEKEMAEEAALEAKWAAEDAAAAKEEN